MKSPPASRPPPSPRPRTPPPPPRPDGPPESADAERRYPRRSTRAATLTPKHRGGTLASPPPPQPRPCEASGTSNAERRYPQRSTRAALTPSQRGPTLALAPPRASVPPTPPPPSVQPTPPPLSVPPTAPPASSTAPPLDAAEIHGSSETASEENDKVIKIETDELNTTLYTMGVSVEERKEVINTVFNKCLAVYNEAVRYEKERCLSMVKEISVLESQYAEICSILGEKEVFPKEFKDSASLLEIQQSLTAGLLRLNVFKKQRLKNLQGMQIKIIDLWDHLGVTIEEQKDFWYMMRNAAASVDEVTEKDALCPTLLAKTQEELKRLEAQMVHEVSEKFAVLAGNLRQTHLSGDKDYELNFTLTDVQDGRICMFYADTKLEELILISNRDILQRADIVNRAELVFNSRNESVSNNEASVESLIGRVKDWEAKNDRKFVYDKQDLITDLLEPAKRKHVSYAISHPAAENGQSPTWSEGSEESESDDQSDDPDFVASLSEEEL